jgi:hypothetical protein
MRYTLFLLALLSVNCMQGQRFTGNLNFQTPLPQGAFTNNLASDFLPGARLQFLYQPAPASPFYVGLDMGWANLDHASRKFDDSVLGFNKKYRLNAGSSFFSLGSLLRFQPANNKLISPYFEGMAGWNVFTHQRSLTETRNSEGEGFDSRTSTTDWAFYYGGGAGLQIRFKAAHRVGLNLSLAYLRGASARYADNVSISDEGEVSFEYKTSRSDMFLPQVGVWFYMDKPTKANDAEEKQ